MSQRTFYQHGTGTGGGGSGGGTSLPTVTTGGGSPAGTFEPNLPPGGGPAPHVQVGMTTPGWGLESFHWQDLLPTGSTAMLADATTAQAQQDGGATPGGAPLAPAVVPVAAAGSSWTYILIAALAIGGYLAWRWWQQHRKD